MLRLTPLITRATPIVLILILVTGFAHDMQTETVQPAATAQPCFAACPVRYPQSGGTGRDGMDPKKGPWALGLTPRSVDR